MRFEWGLRKAVANRRKHGVSFEEALTVFADRLGVTAFDPDHSSAEDRFVTVGVSSRGRLLIVAHLDRGEIVRLINARRLTRTERLVYEEETGR